ncbi:alkanesulfonate monooxygenase [Mycena galericulata]|nr:alkanesulfonate monooxygenase [Mycena galericulata]
MSQGFQLGLHRLNSDPGRVKFAYWVPNISGGLVISQIPQRTHWDLEANKIYARTAERVVSNTRSAKFVFMAGYGAENQHEPVTSARRFCIAQSASNQLLPCCLDPSTTTLRARVAVNVVSGWFKAEFTSIGQCREFIECLKGIWTQDNFTHLNLPGRPHPEIFQGGNSLDARDNAGAVSDVYFMNGNTLQGFIKQIEDVQERARANGRAGQVRFAINGFVICRDTEAEAVSVLQEIQGNADAEAVDGAATSERIGMWADSKFEDLVQYNDGFKTKLIGTKIQIADRILLLKRLGVEILLLAFMHYEDEIQQFGEQVLPLVRQLAKEGRGKDKDLEIALTGDVYREG